jgi:hypothetical protein
MYLLCSTGLKLAFVSVNVWRSFINCRMSGRSGGNYFGGKKQLMILVELTNNNFPFFS